MFAHTVLPPIEGTKPGSLTEVGVKPLEKSAKQKKAVTMASHSKKPKTSIKKPSSAGQEKHKEYGFEKVHATSKWDMLLRQHAKLITPMGLIEHVTREPSELPEVRTKLFNRGFLIAVRRCDIILFVILSVNPVQPHAASYIRVLIQASAYYHSHWETPSSPSSISTSMAMKIPYNFPLLVSISHSSF